MNQRLNPIFLRIGIFIFAVQMFFCSELFAQTRSKMVGSVVDAQTGEPILGANVMILGTSLGATTDFDGKYFIINVPIGTYTIQATMIGYAKASVVGVVVSLDRTSTVDFKMKASDINIGEVVIEAERNALHKEVASTQNVVTEDQFMNTAGVREVSDLLVMQPGVVKEGGFISVRGGSADQTGTMVNGVAFNNAAIGNSSTSIPMSAIEQVSILPGGFNAEYGNFRSGLISVVTKSGSKDKYSGTVNVSRNIPHQKRFGPALSDPKGPLLAPWLDADAAFIGTESVWANDPYKRQQQISSFEGWNKTSLTAATTGFNRLRVYGANGRQESAAVTPLDLYLFAAWMHMAMPDYAGLERQYATRYDSLSPNKYSYITDANGNKIKLLDYYLNTPEKRALFEKQKKLFEQHKYNEEGMDSNVDFGFGGPIPFISEELGDATFYLSHNSTQTYYIQPVTRRSDVSHVTLGTIKSTPITELTLTLTGLYKKQTGVSPIRPPFGDYPDTRVSDDAVSSGERGNGGFLSEDNIGKFLRSTDRNPLYGYLWNMSIYPTMDENTVVGGLTMNYIISKSTFCELSLNYSKIWDTSPTGDNRDNTPITHFGPIVVSEMPYGKLEYAGGSTGSGSNTLTMVDGTDTITTTFAGNDAVPGIGGSRIFRGKEGDLYTDVKVQQYRVKFDINSQFDEHYFKAGFEYNQFDIDHFLWEKWNNSAYNAQEYIYHQKPSQTGIYIQDQMTYGAFVANLGIRADYYYGGGGKWPTGDRFADVFYVPGNLLDTLIFPLLEDRQSYVWKTFQAYNDTVNPNFLQPIKNFLTFSPRIGISFPITEDAKFFFNYGHFRSSPPYYSMYLLRYRYKTNNDLMIPDPNIEPPKTVSYELGVAMNIYSSLYATISGYSKDITGQNGTVTYTGSVSGGTLTYTTWAANQYQDIQGLEISLSKSDNTWITGWVNLNYMFKKSGYTGLQMIRKDVQPLETDYYGQDQESRTLPLPQASASLVLKSPSEIQDNPFWNYLLSSWSASFTGSWKTGDYFTYNPLNKPFINNNLQWPDYYMVDLRLSKAITIAGFKASFFVDIKNVFNIKVNLLSKGYAFARGTPDLDNYLASLRLPMYNSPDYDDLRFTNPGQYEAGNDQVGELRSDTKPYINDPNLSYWIYGEPREIWFGLKIDF